MNERIKDESEPELFTNKKNNLISEPYNNNQETLWAVFKNKTLNLPDNEISSFYMTFDYFLNENKFKRIIENLKTTTSKYLYGQTDFSENTQEKLQFDLSNRIVEDVGKGLKNMSTETYYQYLMKLIANQPLTSPEIYKKALISKEYFSKIITGRNNKKKFIPRKDLLLRIAFAMQLSLEETYILLNKAGQTFIECDRADYIYVYFLDNKIYDIYELEEILNYFELPSLFDI